MEPCKHPRKPGQTRCRDCKNAYDREWRRTAESRAVRRAKAEGREDAMRAVRVALLEAGDTPLTGFSAAQLVSGL